MESSVETRTSTGGNEGTKGDRYSVSQGQERPPAVEHSQTGSLGQSQSRSVGNDNNPWTMSPAVTSTQSELSAVSSICSSNDNNAAGTDTGTNVTVNVEDSTPFSLSVSQEEPQQQPLQVNTIASQEHLWEQQQQHPLETSLLEMSMPSTPASVQQLPPTPLPQETQAVSFSMSPDELNMLQQQESPQAAAPANNTSTLQKKNLVVDTSFQPQTVQPVPSYCSDTTAISPETVEAGSSYQEGGRLWQAALREAEKENNKQESKPRSRFAESIMERTRSRADPNALVSPHNNNCNVPGGKPSMVTLGDNEGSYILSTALAKKRVRVVQLLLIGLVGLLLGLLGNFFVSTSCHFATVNIMVGQNEKTFEFHFGLWKYSPIESVFQGYPYCYKYDQNYANEAPVVARWSNIVALVAGLIAISILWLYLIFGSTDKRRWKWAVRIAVVAGLVQLSTLYFFFGNICQEYSCEFGPGAYLAVFTSVVWFVLACEMHYHMPVAIYASGGMAPNNTISAMEEPSSLVTTMEMTHLDEVTREYITRVTGKTKEDEMPALNMDLKRVRPKSGLYSPTSATLTNGSGLYIPSPRGTYQAPDPSLLEEALGGQQ